MRFLIGTSGFSYKEWKGPFYPEKLPASEMLGFYSRHFDTVEINNTFYRMPRERTLVGWAEQVPEDFRFVLKASRRITHQKQLQDASDEVAYFTRVSTVLGDRLGPTLFQLPPYLRADLDRLDDFLNLLPRNWKAAVEFRHDSWYTPEAFDVLRKHDAALVCADTDDDGDHSDIVSTSSWGYLRLRRDAYSDSDLQAWRERIEAQAWNESYVFFKHEEKGRGPDLSLKLRELVGAG